MPSVAPGNLAREWYRKISNRVLVPLTKDCGSAKLCPTWHNTAQTRHHGLARWPKPTHHAYRILAAPRHRHEILGDSDIRSHYALEVCQDMCEAEHLSRTRLITGKLAEICCWSLIGGYSSGISGPSGGWAGWWKCGGKRGLRRMCTRI